LLAAAIQACLHRLAYVVGICGVLHYLWLAKKANPSPYYYAAVLVLLIAIRGWDWGKRRVGRIRAGTTVPAVSGTGLGRLSPPARRQEEGRS